MKKLDLHIHTTYSDGTLNPKEIINMAINKNISVISFTDHNTQEGYYNAISLGYEDKINIIRGVEIDIKYSSEMHILAYNFQNSEALDSILNKIKISRFLQIEQLYDNFSKIFPNAFHTFIPNINTKIRHLINNIALNYSYNNDEIITKYLLFIESNNIILVEEELPDAKELIKVVHNANGICILAHPNRISRRLNICKNAIEYLISCEIDGIEYYHNNYTLELHNLYKSYVDRYNLIKTVGSDFHGENKKDINLGEGDGSFELSKSEYREIYTRVMNR